MTKVEILSASFDVLDEPLPIAEIRRQFDEDEQVEGVVRVDPSEFFEGGFEGFLDALSEKLVGSDCLSDICYQVVGGDDGDVLFRVKGDPSMILDMADEEKLDHDFEPFETVADFENAESSIEEGVGVEDACAARLEATGEICGRRRDRHPA